MKNKTKACLFGGALMAAGMTANAQEFMFSDTDATGAYESFAISGAYDYYTPFVTDTAYAPDALNTFATAYDLFRGTTTMSTSQTSTELRTEASWSPSALGYDGFGYTFFQQFFQVTEDATMTISWDISGTDGYADAIVVEDTATGALLFAFDGLVDSATGSVDITLEAGVDYAAIFGFQDFLDPLGSDFGPFILDSENTQFISLALSPIPTPGSAATLALAGLVAARRRR
ncbi:MAG: hypothetical protein AAF235_04615 [Planctomycetota bacterium]